MTRLAKVPGLEESLTELGHGLAAGFGAARYSVVLVDGHTGGLRILAGRALPDTVARALFEEGREHVLERLDRTPGRPVRLLTDELRETSPGASGALWDQGVEAVLLFPVRGGGELVGAVVLEVCSTGPELKNAAGIGAAVARHPDVLSNLYGGATLAALTALDDTLLGAPCCGILAVDGEGRVAFRTGVFSGGEGSSGATDWRALTESQGLEGLGRHAEGETEWCGIRVPDAPTLDVSLVAAPAGRSGGARVFVARTREGEGEPRPTLRDHVRTVAEQLTDLTAANRELADVLVSSPAPGQATVARLVADVLVGARDAADHALELAGGVDGVQLNVVLRSLCERLTPVLEESGVRVLQFLRPELARIPGSAANVAEVFRILARVSRDSLPRPGHTMTFRTWEEEGFTYGSVSDDGPGYPEADLEALLDAGSGSEASASLARVRQIVSDHGGRLEVDSRPGVWTRFTVILPGAPELRQSPRVHRLPPAVQVRSDSSGGLQVLVVDDNAALRSVVKRFLERRGHTVVEAADAEEALALLEGREFDRVLVDLQMPGKDGKEFYCHLEGVAPRMRDRTIFMSGALTEEGSDPFIAGTGRPAVRKPFDLVDMARTVEA